MEGRLKAAQEIIHSLQQDRSRAICALERCEVELTQLEEERDQAILNATQLKSALENLSKISIVRQSSPDPLALGPLATNESDAVSGSNLSRAHLQISQLQSSVERLKSEVLSCKSASACAVSKQLYW
jgi:hypothetical protein